jgi:hypothetical protein
VVTKQGFFQTMEAGEFGVGGFLLEVVFPCINRRVHVGEQLGNRLDPLVMLAGDGVQTLRFFRSPALMAAAKPWTGSAGLPARCSHIACIQQ